MVDPSIETSYVCPSLGLMYLAAVLEEESVEVEIVEMRFLDNLWSDFEKIVSKRSPDIVGISTMSYNFRDTVEIANLAKRVNPQIITVVGGPHASMVPEEVLKEESVDVIAIGEGEHTMLHLVHAYETGDDLRKVHGIAFKRNGIVRTAPRSLITDLDELPLPARHLVNMREYRILEETTTVLASRGCPFKCVFCASQAMWGPNARFRGPKKVVDEVEHVRGEYGFDVIGFVDDVFTLDNKKTVEICREFKQRHLNIEWECSTRVDLLSHDLMVIMRQAGCRAIFLGVESGCQEVLNRLRKDTSVEQVEKVVRWAKEIGINTRLSFVLGCPGENENTVRKTIKFARKLKKMGANTINFNLLKAYPGTELFLQPEAFGITFINRDWGQNHGASLFPTCETDSFSMRDRYNIAYIVGELERCWNSG